MPPIVPGAEPFRREGGRVGAVLCHGFTGSPAALRPWAERLATEGLTVDLPLLPGHGTTVDDLNRTTYDDWYAEVERSFAWALARCDAVFAMGLSMGGGLVLRLAEEHPDQVAGLVLVNPAVKSQDWRLRFLQPVLRRVLRTYPGIRNDIRKPGQDEVAYDKVGLQALQSQLEGWAHVVADLPRVTAPIVLLRSAEDHVVDVHSSRAILARVSSTDVREVLLTDSYHVATLDHDAGRIETESLALVRRYAPAGEGSRDAS